MKFREIISLAVLAVLMSASAASAGGPIVFTGNDKAVYLVRNSDDGTFDVVAKPAGGEWKWISRKLTGRVVATSAVDRRLHALLENLRGYMFFGLDGGKPIVGHNPKDSRWPIDANVSLCEARGFNGISRSSLVAVVLRAAPVAQSTGVNAIEPVAETADLASAPAATTSGSLAIFQDTGAEWKLLDELDRIEAAGGDVFATVANGVLHVLVRSPRGQAVRLLTWKQGKWADIPLPPELADRQVIAVASVDARVAVFVAEQDSTKATSQVYMLTLDETESIVQLQPLTLNGKVNQWDATGLPLVATLSNRFALLWQQETATKFTTCDLAGRMEVPADVSILDQLPVDEAGLRILEYFLGGVLFAAILTMFLLRSAGPPRPFMLPPNLRPGKIGKRFVAGMIDLLPCSFVGQAILGPSVQVEGFNTTGEFLELVRMLATSQAQAYATMLGLGLYVSYCVIMELRFGATLGKIAMKLRVVAQEGNRLGLREALLRNLWKILELLWPPGLPPLLLGFPILNRNRQRIGDLVARSAVVEVMEIAPPPLPEEQSDEEQPGPD